MRSIAAEPEGSNLELVHRHRCIAESANGAKMPGERSENEGKSRPGGVWEASCGTRGAFWGRDGAEDRQEEPQQAPRGVPRGAKMATLAAR